MSFLTYLSEMKDHTKSISTLAMCTVLIFYYLFYSHVSGKQTECRNVILEPVFNRNLYSTQIQ